MFRIRPARWMAGAVLMVTAAAGGASAQEAAQVSCDAFLPPPREVKGKKVGPQSCLLQESDLTVDGRAYKRLELGLNGTVDGYLTRTGDYKEDLTNAPDLVFEQTADPGPILFGVAAYERDKGAGLAIIYPADLTAWNRKVWVTAHGRGVSFKEGQLRAWNRNVNPANPLRGIDQYEQLMLAKGFALVKTRRTSTEGLGEIIVTLEDGSTVDYAAFNDSHRYIMDFATVAGNAIVKRLGRVPARTYLYGHSAGARIGQGINYTPGLNTRADGKPFFDGFLADDGAAGGWLPIYMKDGKDVLLVTDAAKAAFAPQLDVSHQNYNNIWPSKRPDWMSNSYLENKRQNARVLREKGLTPKHRMYEVRSISHSGSGGGLNLAVMMDTFIDMLDAWVDKGVAPPPSRSDWAVLGDVNRDGVIELPGLDFPDVACPLGAYYPTTALSGTMAFAPFTGQGLEPLDRNQVFVDMNRNGVWDFRETPAQAWRRVGLLQKGEDLTREKYVACITAATERLRKDGFISDKTAAAYIEQAPKTDLMPKELPAPAPRR